MTHGYVISHSAPHIYVNASVFTPPESTLSLLAKQEFHTSPKLVKQPNNIWDPRLLTLNNKAEVKSVAFSPDGTKIVSGSWDNTLRVWDAETGLSILGPLLGHTSHVNSVAFSPDGTKIVSGSWDNTLRAWDAETGLSILGPLLGHTSGVNSVAFSPDGTKIVSGSWDKTLRVWDAETGLTTHDPFYHPIIDLSSATFTPDGTRIILVSRNNTFHMWDPHTRSCIPHAYIDNTVPFLAPCPTLSDDGWMIDPGHLRLLWIPSHLRHDFNSMASFQGIHGAQLVWFNEQFIPMIVVRVDFSWWSQKC